MKTNYNILSVCFFFILLAVVFGSTNAQTKDKVKEEKVINLFAKWDNTHSPGAAVLIIKNGKTIFKRGFGMANLEYDIPITTSTIFDIASVSKQFTGLAAAILIKEGKLSLDDDIHKYLPEIHDFSKKITIGNLIYHTSGLRDWPELMILAGRTLADIITYEDIMKIILKQRELDFQPGEEFLYSNSGYNLLAEIIHRIAGKTLREWSDEKIFKPLGMKNTYFHDNYYEVAKNLAYSYVNAGENSYSKAISNLTAVGSSSLFTSIDDLEKWVNNFYYPKICKNEVIDLMQEPGKLNNNVKVNYAFGQVLGEYKGLKIISHSGGWAGYRSELLRFPENNFNVVILSNSPELNPTARAFMIADIYLADKFKLPDPSLEGNTAFKLKGNENAKVVMLAGDFNGWATWKTRFGKEGNDWVCRIDLKPGKYLYKFVIDGNWITDPENPVKEDDGYGHINSVLYAGDQDKIKNEGNKQPEYTPKQLKEFTGKYYCSEVDNSFTVLVNQKQLKIYHWLYGEVGFSPIAKDEFRGMGTIKFYRNDSNEIKGFKFSASRVRNVRFEKISD